LGSHPTISKINGLNWVHTLATQIVERTTGGEAVTIAVTPFRHSNDQCSEMSNFIADELIYSLLQVGDGKVSIVERAQLQSIFEELKFNLSGAVDTQTAKKLGELYGVDALVLGSINKLGDQVRLTSRMVDTETGTVKSAARSSVPLTDDVRELMESGGQFSCSQHTQSGSVLPSSAPTASTKSASTNSEEAVSFGNTVSKIESKYFDINIVEASFRENGKKIILRASLLNKHSGNVWVSLSKRPRSSISDDWGDQYDGDFQMSGVRECPKGVYASNCLNNDKRYSTVGSGQSIYFILRVLRKPNLKS